MECDGKVKKVIRTSTSTKAGLEFTYDAMGNQVSKTVKNGTTPDTWETTYYLRDAAGNVMAIYKGSNVLDGTGVAAIGVAAYECREQHIYGS